MSKSTISRVGLGLSGGVSIALLMATTALAQSAPASEETAAKPALELEELVVTADRKGFNADLVQAGSFRGARQIDTPLTVSVITNEVLQTQQVQGLLDALRNTAGVTSSQTAPSVYSNLAIRGINVENRGNYRLNGSLPIINLIDLPIEDKERVEALKGASALYYGFTAPSGIINLTMKRPTQTPFTQATLFGNSHGAAGAHIDTGGTWGMFGARINAVYATVDSGIDNTEGNRSLIAGAFDFKPTDDLTFSLDAEHIFKRVPEPGIFRFTTVPTPTVANPYPSITLPPLLKASTNFGPEWADNRAEETNVLAHAVWKITDTWAATLDGGISKLSRDRRFATLNPTNLTTGEGTLSVGLQPNAYFENRNVRAELAGTFYTGPFLHEILIGTAANIRDGRSGNTTQITCPGATPTAPRVTCTQNFYNPRDIPETAMPLQTGPVTRISDYGLYVFDRVKYGEWLQLLAGVRKSDYTEENLTTGVETFSAKPTAISYGVVIKPRTWASLYATYIEGLESTPGAPSTAVNAGEQLGPAESTQKEAGVKIEPRSGLLFQAAYFDIDRASTYVNGSNVYVKDGRARYKGAELSLTGEVTSDLSVYASALFLDATQESGAPTVITTSPSGVVTVSPSAVGKDIENTAKRTYSLAGEYRFTEMVPGLSVNAAVYYVGKRAINSLNQAYIPGYTLFDLGAGYRTEIFDRDVTFRVSGQNIFNKKYWASTGGLLLAQGAPSQVKFSVSTRF